MRPVRNTPTRPALTRQASGSAFFNARYVSLHTDESEDREMPVHDAPAVVVAAPLPPPPETWWQMVWRLLSETANPRTTHTEDLTPAERLKQATFESFDYYKPYPAMYLRYLREKGLAARALQPSAAAGEQRGEEEGAEEAVEGSSLAGDALSRLRMSLPADEADRRTALRWLLHVLIALSVGVVATVVSYAVDIMESYRADALSRVIANAPFRVLGYAFGFVLWLLTSVVLVAIAAGVVVYFEPAASGGGIPDVMAYLNGVHVPKAMNIRTFVAKAISCVCAVAGGLPVGLEAPLIHLGAITGAGVTQGRSRSLGFQTPFFQAFRNNKDRRDFITAGAACGVSAAFGAPIGGLLFVMEEVSSFWDHSASGQIFLATMICFTVTTIINSLVEDNRLLGWVSNAASVLFEVNLTIPLNLVSIVPSIVLGAILGALAALFTKANLIMIKWRREVLRPFPIRRFLEPVVVAALYSTLMFTFTLLSDCRGLKAISDVNDTAHVWGTEGAGRLFNDTCPKPDEYSPLGTLNLATGKNTIRHLFTRQTVGEFPVYYLVLHFLLYFVFACVSSGMALSGGLVVPSLVIGAIFGRLFGLLLWYAGATRGVVPGVDRSYGVNDAWMDPGVFALIGAGAFLAGTSRMAMSICVIMVELSSELHYLLPVMAAIVMSKTVADWLCEPLYHEMLHLDSVPYLSASLALPELEQLTVADVMASPVVVLRRRERAETVLRVLRNTTHHAFPVVVEVPGDAAARQHEVGASQRRDRPPREAARAGTPHSPSLVRGLDGSPVLLFSNGAATATHMKFVGLVTREDLLVYLTLPQLKKYEPSVETSLAQQVNSRHRTEGVDYDDGFGGQLAQCVVDINRMSWTQWGMHKASLFLATGDHYDWVRRHVPDGATSSADTGAEEKDEKLDSHDDNSVAGGTSEAPLLPPVLDLTIIINRSPWVITPSVNFKVAYHTFRTMGLRHMVVVDGDVVRGILTRKDLVVDSLRQRMKELRARLDGQQAGGDCPQSEQRSPSMPSAASVDGSNGYLVVSPSLPSQQQQRQAAVAARAQGDDGLGELLSGGGSAPRPFLSGPPPARAETTRSGAGLLWDD